MASGPYRRAALQRTGRANDWIAETLLGASHCRKEVLLRGTRDGDDRSVWGLIIMVDILYMTI